MAVAAVVIVAAGVTVGVTTVSGGGSGPRPVARQVTSPPPAPPLPATNASPDGVQARWVVAENAKPGTTAWKIGAQAGATITGYADHTSAATGDTVKLFVSTAAPSFHVEAYRMGYYGGTGARLIWRSGPVTGTVQPPCPVTPGINMVSCAWTPSLSVPITPAWVQGDYLLKLVGDPGQASYVPLTVSDPTSHATYLVLNSVLTWQAWNTYGGHNILGKDPTDPNRSRVVSYDRPYDLSDGTGSADFLTIEYPFLRFAEQHGLDVTYVTDIALTDQPALAANHKTLISLGHNEFWTAAERQAVVAARFAGVNLMFLGATPGLRPARLQPSPLGPDRELVDYRNPNDDPITASDPSLSTPNQWAGPPLNSPSSQIVGNTYGGFGINVPMVIVTPDAWPFAGTGLTAGSQLPGVIAGDYDTYEPTAGEPTNIEILAHSPLTTTYGHHGTADMTYYSEPGGAGVFATGTIGWIPTLTPCPPGTTACVTPSTQAITANVLHVFGTGPAGRVEPSVGNVSQYYPAGGAPT